MKCPCCGAETSYNNIDIAEAAKDLLTPDQYRVFNIINSRPWFFKHQMLVDVVYQDDPDGGPLTASVTVYSHISNVNKRLKAIGVKIAKRQPRKHESTWGVVSLEARQ